MDINKLHENPEEYIHELETKLTSDNENQELMSVLAAVHFEMGNASLALPILERAVALDPTGIYGPQKMFWLGQLYGGRKGLSLYGSGVKSLNNILKDLDEKQHESKLKELQVSQAYLGMIDIWMTDLCMEPEAETECVRLIESALALDENNPETWSVLASIRISQLNSMGAKEALLKSWELYCQMFENERVDFMLIPQLVRLAQSMTELRMFEKALEVTGQLYFMDDQVAELYYINALCHQAMANEESSPLERSKRIVASRDAANMLFELTEEIDSSVVQATQDILDSLPTEEVENPWEAEDDHLKIRFNENI